MGRELSDDPCGCVHAFGGVSGWTWTWLARVTYIQVPIDKYWLATEEAGGGPAHHVAKIDQEDRWRS